jgi:hypothetical protein
MPKYRGTLLFNFNGPPPAGFSESYGFNDTNDGAAATNVSNWANVRRNFLSNSWQIVGYRVAKVESYLKPASGPTAASCQFKYTPVTIQACPAPVVGLLGVTDTPYTAVLIDFFRDDAKHPRTYMARGIPDTWWTAGALSIPIADNALLNAWFSYMKNTVGFGALDRGPNNLGPPKTTPSTCTLAIHPYVAMCVKRIASRRIGRPFDLLRGRR